MVSSTSYLKRTKVISYYLLPIPYYLLPIPYSLKIITNYELPQDSPPPDSSPPDYRKGIQ